MSAREPHEASPIVDLPRADKLALGIMVALLLLILFLRLFLVLVVGLSVFALHRGLTALMARTMPLRAARVTALMLVLLLFAGIGTLVVGGTSHVSSTSAVDVDGLPRFMHFMADTLERLRSTLPAWVVQHLPETPADLQATAARWLREHAAELQTAGMHTLRALAHVLAGIVIGLLASMAGRAPGPGAPPFARAWHARLVQLEDAFVNVAAAQLRISLINTTFTAIYLFAVLPLLGHHMPFRGTLIGLTFVMGLLPIVGNLVSNAAIVVTSLTLSPWVGLLSLAFLVGVHKLEYFLNAHIVGGRIHVPSYELLAAMLVFEAAFGLPGLVAAPIYTAWAMRELRDAGTV